MNITEVATVAVAVVSIGGVILGLVAWFYKRGGQEQAYTDALNRNTKATTEVAEKLDGFKAVVVDMFHDLDKRVTLLESEKK